MLKQGVDLRGLHPVWGIAFTIIHAIYTSKGVTCVITSANDSKHGDNSLHYKGKALDLRTHHLPDALKKEIFRSIKHALGAQFDVILESEGLPNEHMHVEFDPKEPEHSEDV